MSKKEIDKRIADLQQEITNLRLLPYDRSENNDLTEAELDGLDRNVNFHSSEINRRLIDEIKRRRAATTEAKSLIRVHVHSWILDRESVTGFFTGYHCTCGARKSIEIKEPKND